MPSTFGTHSEVAKTVELLRTALPPLEKHRQSLETELTAVTERLESVRAALHSLQLLSSATPTPQPEAGEPTPAKRKAGSRVKAKTPAKARTAVTSKATVTSKAAVTSKARKPSAAKAAASPAPAAPQPVLPKQRIQGLTRNLVAYLARADAPVRAREAALALGREDTPGSINAVRTALERLVKAGRAQRTGRGLYEATSAG
ncbi:hypothetical protein [Streptomyces netropsis]|uniref:Putative membrane protein n=1 Tax=Streptomyces netropsis TaxID=55404 RepID=A0A7W7LGQ6_STRNE|nr:hypothetical protein [Streptomyces netropsis]MBB4889246.1 putative membrane protein [Streptomyces netropsis]GGR47000.1 hypothetical protein GCM10010219_60630 [Streptomyces netropsis]